MPIFYGNTGQRINFLFNQLIREKTAANWNCISKRWVSCHCTFNIVIEKLIYCNIGLLYLMGVQKV